MFEGAMRGLVCTWHNAGFQEGMAPEAGEGAGENSRRL
ncbi:hypothetical protein PCL1606_34880 [Pseudomonas chlororaphis]|uniref:Uncharacterized protein n=1 Tax=Pseudomonas chlororaphis TaxID=587753 RepID=A0A0D5Y0S4_9PSED|nr:hypothetical protein PCL1606_34880 [Pseudomonas chlororaphis]